MNSVVATVPSRTLSAPSGPRRSWVIAAGAAAILLMLAALWWWQIDGAAEILAFQGARARSAREAERAYGTIAREHTGSRQREYALLKLAQLEIAKGDVREALQWLDRLHRDYPAGAPNAERQYWTARALLAGADTVRACAVTRGVNAVAAATLGADFSSMKRDCIAFDARRQAGDSVQTVNGTVADTSERAVRPAGASIPPLPLKRDSLQ